MTNEYVIIEDMVDEYASVKPGEPFRLFKYGPLYKGGKERDITKDQAFKMPHFLPQIKLGSHEDVTASGGSITGLEMREDGVWANTEWNEAGIKALDTGAYRYHSPEVIWEGGYIENPDNGNKIEGPIIVGVALTHTPHLGEQTALYTYEPTEENNMSELTEVVAKNTSVIEKFMSLFDKEDEPNEPEVKADEFTAVKQERDDYAAKIEQFEADKEQAVLMTAIKAEFDKDDFGAAFKEYGKSPEMLASMNEDQRAWVIQEFGALSKQIDESKLTGEIGESDDAAPEGKAGVNARIEAYKKENKVSYKAAMDAVFADQPELYEAYVKGD